MRVDEIGNLIAGGEHEGGRADAPFPRRHSTSDVTEHQPQERQTGHEQQRAQHELAGQILRDNQWRVIDVPHGMGVADAWSALEQLNTAA